MEPTINSLNSASDKGGYRCESGIAIFAWKVTWNYTFGSTCGLVTFYFYKFEICCDFTTNKEEKGGGQQTV